MATKEWCRDLRQRGRPERLEIHHGDTWTLKARLLEAGAAASLSDVTSAKFYWQSADMVANWYEKTATVDATAGTLSASFGNSDDAGADLYRFFFQARTSSGRTFVADGTLAMLDSPGFEPSEVAFPVKTLDFSSVTVLNAPYYTKSEAAAASHTHSQSDVTGLESALTGKASYADAAIHYGDTTLHCTAAEKANWNGKASASHTHAQADITGLTTDLAAKADASALTAHTSSTSNPHGVTAAQAGAVPVATTAGGTEASVTDTASSASLLLYGSTVGVRLTAGATGTVSLLHPMGTYTLTMPEQSGTLAVTSDITSAVSTHAALATHITAAERTAWTAKADASALRYAFGYLSASGTLSDRAITAVTVSDQAVSLSFPEGVTGKARDFLLYIDATGFESGGALSISWPALSTRLGDDPPTISAAGKWLMSVTELAESVFYIRTITLS